MQKVIVLGGCGAVGSVAVRALTQMGEWSKILIGDINVQRAQSIASELDDPRLRAVRVDAMSSESVTDAITGCDIVLNCVGPFYKSVKTILGAVLDAGIDYVDVCDDVDVTLDILQWDERAKQSGTLALIGMGASPGTTNLFAKYIADNFLDECESVDIFHTHGGEPIEGPGVIGHRFHCMSIDIPMFLEGELKYVRYFEEDGIALRQTFDFPMVGKGIPIFPYPHPEQVTLPRYMDLKQVTNKGSVLPIEYYNMTADACKIGLTSRDPIDVQGQPVAPYDFAIAYLIQQRDRILKEQNFGSQRGCMSVVVKGKKAGERMEYRMHIASESAGLGEGTGLPAAIATTLLAQGKITAKGVLPPEACVDPGEFIATSLALPQMSSGASITIEQELADGTINQIPL
jgi:saccharopine dehydrogenase (NAD+, L-lysine-forming)